MSMISSQCDDLRDTAMRVEIFLEGSTDAIPTDTHEQLRRAADTIWELRCKLADMVDQRDELRHENADMKRQLCYADEIIGRQGTKIEKTEAENEQLRELCKELYPFVGDACPPDCKHREECEGEDNRGARGFPLVCVAYNRYFEEMSELGIEVDR